MDDFDPLNQNAKQIPPVPKRPPAVLPQELASSVAFRGSSQGRNPAFSNPVYPYFTPLKQTQPAAQPLNTTKHDDDVELLRKYGLDHFSLNQSKVTNTAMNDIISNPFAIGKGNRNSNRTSDSFQSNGGDVQPKANNNWTTFD